MLRRMKELEGLTLGATDGEIGTVKQFYFDDHRWTIRYLVADTGGWLDDRQVLISPRAIDAGRTSEKLIPVRLTKAQIENSPRVGSGSGVSREFEQEYYRYYDWPIYWSGPYVWGATDYPTATLAADALPPPSLSRLPAAENTDPNLRTSDEVTGYNIEASDGEIGHVDDFIVDDETWTIRYLVVATKNWWPGKKVLLSPHWIDKVSWHESKVHVGVSREVIKQAPEYDHDKPITRDFEERLHRYYKRDVYWPSAA